MTIGLERVDDPVVQRNFDRLEALFGVLAEIPVFVLGSGTPEGAIVASPPARCYVRAGGASATLYLKLTGTGTNVGWKAVQTVP